MTSFFCMGLLIHGIYTLIKSSQVGVIRNTWTCSKWVKMMNLKIDFYKNKVDFLDEAFTDTSF